MAKQNEKKEDLETSVDEEEPGRHSIDLKVAKYLACYNIGIAGQLTWLINDSSLNAKVAMEKTLMDRSRLKVRIDSGADIDFAIATDLFSCRETDQKVSLVVNGGANLLAEGKGVQGKKWDGPYFGLNFHIKF